MALTEIEQRLQSLTNAILAGRVDEARQSTYAALTKGSTTNEVLDAVVEAVNILVDLNEVDAFDQTRLSSSENAVNSCLQAVEDRLSKAEGRLNLKVTVGPVGLRAGAILALMLSATLRSIGFEAVCLSKTQTALDLLRNSEEAGADLVISLLGVNDVEEQLRRFTEEFERGGFRSKFEVIHVAPGLPKEFQTSLTIARNSTEAIGMATEWALKRRSAHKTT
jgi:methanogenic corrinoid protein MtbC1